MPPEDPPRGIRPRTLLLLWLALGALTTGAWFGLPVYLESLERRIVFRAPDCMDVAREQARSAPVDVSERGDSLEAWMKGCLEERQDEMVRHADLVGYGTMGMLTALSIVLTALIIQAAWVRLSRARGPGE